MTWMIVVMVMMGMMVDIVFKCDGWRGSLLVEVCGQRLEGCSRVNGCALGYGNMDDCCDGYDENES